ncbi:MAG: Asp-tRNA(Asn)/Glu-tRNA(Gln) amidotransferase subunit GatC [Phycisphaeraceae bacterium]|nr:Asp-tRNA(Asn)/Glu-tRNA(Gln) amidotransferase subunit GatC [Phycisphaeraceae bacterium]
MDSEREPAQSGEPVELTDGDVHRVARLARLAIPHDEVAGYRQTLAAVLGYVQRLQTLDLEGVEPLARVTDEPHRLRKDEPGVALPTEALMKMAPASMAPFVEIPKVLGDGGA